VLTGRKKIQFQNCDAPETHHIMATEEHGLHTGGAIIVNWSDIFYL